MVLRGLSMVCDDDQVLAVTRPIFDGLYEFFRRELLLGREPVMTDPTANGQPPTAESIGEQPSSTGDVVPLGQATKAWFQISLQTFGGPAGQIAVMQHKLVDEKRWISQPRFLHALNYCMLLPGPEAQQLAIYTGWLLNGTRGGLVAGTLFVLPGMLALLVLSSIYVAFGDTTVSPPSSPDSLRR